MRINGHALTKNVAVIYVKRLKKNKRNAYLKLRYGITEEQFNLLIQRQGRRCPICLRLFKQILGRPNVDHNHKTGELRGCLCRYCNHRVVGRHTDPALLRRVANYLEFSKTGWFVPKRRVKRRRRKTSRDL